MAKKNFSCTECNNTHSQWSGVCNFCNNWNTIFENEYKPKDIQQESRIPMFINSNDLKNTEPTFRRTGLNEFDSVIGGGIVDGTIIILSGGPGVGKSTLLLKVISYFSQTDDEFCLYCSGEESVLKLDKG